MTDRLLREFIFAPPCAWIVLASFLLLAACSGGTSFAQGSSQPTWLAASSQKLPRWRGFNLLEKFYWNKDRKPFLEDDFRLIAKLGFNFVRLPMDYRCWIVEGDWERFDEATLKEIDQAVELGDRYGIHVCLNFHRAPGYTVARPPEPKSLWTDADAQRVCAKHWAEFARRYKGIPSDRVSFNLMNEPSAIEPKVHFEVVRKLVEAIRAEDPERLIIADGLSWGNVPVPDLRPLNIAQATRGYIPMEISHYQASWVGGERFPLPVWPRPIGAHGTLYGPAKKELSAPLVLNGPFPKATELRMHVMTVSQGGTLVVEGDGKKLWEKVFECGPGEGEWKKAEYKEQWKIYQNLYDRDYTAPIPEGTQQVKVSMTQGDWLQVGQIGLKSAEPGAKEDVLTLDLAWGEIPKSVTYTPGAPGGPFTGIALQDREWLWKTRIEPWKKLEAMGVGVMVGEWGAFNKTPHDVALRWMEDCLTNWKKANWGWALWNFRGGFGILDSGRTDVEYEDFEGHKLDRKMLDLLQRY